MNAYIAYSYKSSPKLSQKILVELRNANINAFSPGSIELSAVSLDEMGYVDLICCNKIRESDIFVAIYPFGLSVSIEIGRFLELKERDKTKKRTLIILDMSEKESDAFNKLRGEAMLIPHVDAIVTSIRQLLKEINKITYKTGLLNL